MVLGPAGGFGWASGGGGGHGRCRYQLDENAALDEATVAAAAATTPYYLPLRLLVY